MNKNTPFHFIYLETVDSTKDWLRREMNTLDFTALNCLRADTQTRGKGSKQLRSWFSPPGVNLYASFFFVLKPETDVQEMGKLLSVSALKLCLELGFETELKWPNDLMIHGKKLGGVLIETVQLPDQLGVIASLGLNVNMPEEMLPFISQPATSLSLESGSEFSIDLIFKKLAVYFLDDLLIFTQQGFTPFISFYEKFRKRNV